MVTHRENMDTNEYLRKTQPEVVKHGKGSRFNHQDVRPYMVLGDGTTMSVQASRIHYCTPRENGLSYYERVEVGYPSEKIDELMEYAEDLSSPTETVYGYVPVSVIDDIATKRGGIVGVAFWIGGTKISTLFAE